MRVCTLVRLSLKGIWSARPALISQLGEDMSGVLKEESPSEPPLPSSSPPPPPLRLPTGLKNLGATCYLNSQLQALFANKRFREGVFSWRPSAGTAAAATAAAGTFGRVKGGHGSWAYRAAGGVACSSEKHG